MPPPRQQSLRRHQLREGGRMGCNCPVTHCPGKQASAASLYQHPPRARPASQPGAHRRVGALALSHRCNPVAAGPRISCPGAIADVHLRHTQVGCRLTLPIRGSGTAMRRLNADRAVAGTHLQAKDRILDYPIMRVALGAETPSEGLEALQHERGVHLVARGLLLRRLQPRALLGRRAQRNRRLRTGPAKTLG